MFDQLEVVNSIDPHCTRLHVVWFIIYNQWEIDATMCISMYIQFYTLSTLHITSKLSPSVPAPRKAHSQKEQ